MISLKPNPTKTPKKSESTPTKKKGISLTRESKHLQK